MVMAGPIGDFTKVLHLLQILEQKRIHAVHQKDLIGQILTVLRNLLLISQCFPMCMVIMDSVSERV